MRRLLIPLAASSALLFGCATTRPAQPPEAERIELPPEQVTGNPRLARMNDEELFAEGTAAFAANDFARAADAFGRIADNFPKSAHRLQATFNAGLSLERLERWGDAKPRFTAIADPHGGGDALDAEFRLAEVDYHLGAYDEAAKLLAPIADRTDLPLDPRIEARVQQGICELEAGGQEAAEKTLRAALDLYQSAPRPEDLDDYFPAQAEFFLGEIYRLREEAVALDPNQSADQLGGQLEYKAELLLSAQGHYLRAIRIGNGYWATAAGAQVGGMYEGLYRYLSDAPTPKELAPDAAQLYRTEVKKRIRVLLAKAISIYESTLEAADRVGTTSAFVDQARAELEKLKALLASEEPPAPTTTPPPRKGLLHPDSLGPPHPKAPPGGA